jgi:hypothetical protein
MSAKDVKTFSARNHAAERDIRMTTEGEPPTNQDKSGKLPQNKIDNMVSRKKQLTNAKAKAAAATAAAADAAEAEVGVLNNNQDSPILYLTISFSKGQA